MRTIIIGAVAISALALAGCHPKPLSKARFEAETSSLDDKTPLKAPSTLDCPATEGALTRTAQAADGKSCDYSGPQEESVHLSLVALDGKSPADGLSPIRTELQGLIPPEPGAAPVKIEASKDEGSDRAKVDMPFLHVDANGKKAKVRILGFNIDADDDKATIKGDVPGMKNTTIHAGPNGAEVSSDNTGKANASLVYVLAGEGAGKEGYHAVGYVARGPKDGPLVVGAFKVKGGHFHHDDEEHGDIGRLIERNLKGGDDTPAS